MVLSFPAEEYRPLEELRLMTDREPAFYNNIVLHGLEPVGLLTYWDLGCFYYGEHFAIDPGMRNGGYGRAAMEWLCARVTPLVLEVEMPEEEMARRRIGFYQRLGFQLWNNDYLQPPYRKGDRSFPLRLMAYGALDSEKDFAHVRRCIYNKVYGADVSDV